MIQQQKTNTMKNLKEINQIKNLLIEAKHTSLIMDNFDLTSKLDIALTAFVNEYDRQTKGKSGAEVLEQIR